MGKTKGRKVNRGKRSVRKGRLAAAGLLAVILLAVLFPGGCKQEENSGKTEETEQESAPLQENELSEAGNTENIQAEVKEDPDRLTGETSDMTGEEEPGEEVPDQDTPSNDGTGVTGSVSGSGKDSREKYSGDIMALDNTSWGWGQGVQFDAWNRPAGATSYQEKYGQYSADFIRMGEEESNRIYLTFDEGYENGYTSQILDVLKEKNCPAVFFVTMPYVKQQPELIRRMIDEGHIVGNHSVTHPSAGLPSQSREQQEQELMELHQYVKDNFGYEMSLFRYPAGKFSEQSLAIVQSLDYTSVFWSFAYKDWDPDNQPDEAEALSKLKERLHPGAIYLLHAVSRTNTHILGQFIDDARAAGYEFVSYR